MNIRSKFFNSKNFRQEFLQPYKPYWEVLQIKNANARGIVTIGWLAFIYLLFISCFEQRKWEATKEAHKRSWHWFFLFYQNTIFFRDIFMQMEVIKRSLRKMLIRTCLWIHHLGGTWGPLSRHRHCAQLLQCSPPANVIFIRMHLI